MFKTIRIRIITTCIVIVIFSLTVSTFFSYTVAEKYNKQAVDSTLNALASSYPHGISDWVKSKSDMVVSLQQAALTSSPLPALQQIALAGDFSDVYVGYANKITLFTGEPADADPTQRPWYKQAAQAGHPIITPPYFDIASQTLVVTFATPLIKDGHLHGVIGGDVSMDSVINYVKSLDPLPGSFGMLIDRSGIIIAHPDPKMTLKTLASVAKDLDLHAILTGDTPVDVEFNGEIKRAKAMPITGTDWYILVVQDKDTSSAAMHSLLISSVIIMILLAIVSAITISFIITRSFRRLSMVRDMLDTMGTGDGDLTQRLPTNGHDEVTQIANAFNTFVDKLSKIILEIRTTSEFVKSAADEIATGNNELSCRTESSTASLQQTSASLAQITNTVSQSVFSAKQACETAKFASDAASQGDSIMSEVINTMSRIEKASSKVGDITGVIDSIAFQTNILALNAAVEAARAGEQGRGFAVVASEVRSLARNSAQAAKEIKVLIESTISSVASGVELVQFASSSMTEIVCNVSNVSTVMQEMTHSSENQMLSINEINRAIEELDKIVQKNADMVGRSASASSLLQERATGLAVTVGSFKV